MSKALFAGGGVVAFLLGAMFSEIIPEPTDPLSIWFSDWLKVHQTTIPTWQYWTMWGFNQYLLGAVWYLLLLVMVFGLDLELRERFFLGLGLISGGVVVGLLGVLAIGRELPGVGNLGLGYTVFFAGIATLISLAFLVSYHFLNEGVDSFT